MAEAVAAVADAVIAVCATILVMTTLFTVIIPGLPYFAAALAWMGVTRMLVGIDVFLALGTGLFVSMMIWPAAQFQWGGHGESDITKAISVMQQMKGNAAIGGFGLFAGLTNLATGQPALALIGGAAGAFLGVRYGWNMLSNLYLSLNVLGTGSCPQGQGQGVQGVGPACIPICEPAEGERNAKAFLATNPQCANPPAGKAGDWCREKLAFYTTCPYLAKPPDPGPQTWYQPPDPSNPYLAPFLPACMQYDVGGAFWTSPAYTNSQSSNASWGPPARITGPSGDTEIPTLGWNESINQWQCNFGAQWLHTNGTCCTNTYDYSGNPPAFSPPPPKSK